MSAPAPPPPGRRSSRHPRRLLWLLYALLAVVLLRAAWLIPRQLRELGDYGYGAPTESLPTEGSARVDGRVVGAWTGEPRVGVEVVLTRVRAAEPPPGDGATWVSAAAPAVVTDEEIREAYQRQFGRACAEYIGVRFSDLEDEWEPSEEQILAYYESRPNEIKSQAQGRAKVVSWSRVPSDADREEVLELAMEIKAGIESGENDFAAEAAIYSQDGTANNGGDLGTFDRNRMVEPFTEVAFSLPVGQISEPVATQFGLHLIEVLEQIEEEGEITQVHARHILLKVEPSEATLGDIYTRADEFRESVNRDDFVARATADSLALIDPELSLSCPAEVTAIAGCNFVFRAEAGTVSRVLGNKDVYYVVLCEGVDEAGQAPLDEVRSQVVVSLKNEHNRELASAKLAPALAEVQQGQAMAEIAEKHGLAHAVTDTINANANVPDVGYATAFNTLALHASLETLIPQVETMRGVFAMRVLWQEPFDDTLFNTSKESLRQSLLIQKQNELLEAWFNDRLAKADVKDERP